MLENLGKIIDVNGKTVGKVNCLWLSKRLVFIKYKDGTSGCVGDEKFVQHKYLWVK